MAILITCACGRRFLTVEENVGRRAGCLDCGRELVIPEAGPHAESAGSAGLDWILFTTSGKATASLVLGLLSLLCAAFAGLPAIVLGCLGLIDIKKSRGRMSGRAAALSGVALGVLGSTVVAPALVLPVFRAAREWVWEPQCVDNLKQIALAIHNYESEYGVFPTAAITDRRGQPLLSWRVAILPHLGAEGEALYREFHLDEPWDSPHNRPLLDRMPAVYACPDEPRGRPPTTNYLAVVGPGKLFTERPNGVKLREITAGTSNTLMVTESDRPVPWSAPEEVSANLDVEGPDMGSRHPGGYHVAMADGSVRYLSLSGSGRVAGVGGGANRRSTR